MNVNIVFVEVLGFVSHTCLFGLEACQVRAGDCAEYTRLHACCCHSYLASRCKHWPIILCVPPHSSSPELKHIFSRLTGKYLAGGASCTRTSHPLLGLAVLFVILGAVR